jgi:hypothetical protein
MSLDALGDARVALGWTTYDGCQWGAVTALARRRSSIGRALAL